MRVKCDWRSGSKDQYHKFCKKYPNLKLSFDEWKNIIYTFNELIGTYLLETGNKVRLPGGFGEIAINKKKRKKFLGKNDEFIGLPIDWKKTLEKGRKIYNFNYHTEGYFFGWHWFKNTARFKQSDLWRFKATRNNSRLLKHYITADNKYQHLYKSWIQQIF